jgi:hypothetical protein
VLAARVDVPGCRRLQEGCRVDDVGDLPLECGAPLVGREEWEQEPAQSGLVALAAVGLHLDQPAVQLRPPLVSDRPGAAPRRAAAGLLDQPAFLQPGQLGVDLAVARTSGVGGHAHEQVRGDSAARA